MRIGPEHPTPNSPFVTGRYFVTVNGEPAVFVVAADDTAGYVEYLDIPINVRTQQKEQRRKNSAKPKQRIEVIADPVEPGGYCVVREYGKVTIEALRGGRAS